MTRRQAMRKRAYAISRTMTWERTAERYMAVFENARQGHWLKVIARTDPVAIEPHSAAAPDMKIGHFLSMCDDTGLFQHAVHSVPDRSHGYCVDDNARALLLACALNNPGEQRLSEVLTARFAAFVQHAWNPDTRRFRNFMGFNRTWLEDSGSEDSHGRTLWALGECARSDASPSRADGRPPCLPRRLPPRRLSLARAWAFTLLGLDAYCAVAPDDFHAQEVRPALADRLMAMSRIGRDAGLGMVRGRACLRQRALAAGLDGDRHGDANARLCRCRVEIPALADDTTNRIDGSFPPGRHRRLRRAAAAARAFDQQPVEATATIAACLTAWRADGDAEWKAIAAKRLRLVPRQQRSIRAAGRSAHRKLPRRTASRSCQ